MKLDRIALLWIVLVWMVATSCSPTSAPPPETQIQPADRAPQFWRDAKTRVRFDGSSSNLTLIARYLGEGMYRRQGPGFVWALYGARGHAYYEGPLALGEQEVEFAVVTPPAIGKMVMEGKGYFKKPYPSIRALAVRGESVSEARLFAERACEKGEEVREWQHGHGDTKTTGTTGRVVDRDG